MEAMALTELYARIFSAIDDAVEEDWERIAISYEMEFSADELVEDRIGAAITRDANGQLEQIQVPFTSAAKQLFRELNDAVLDRDGQRPGSIELLMDANGKYRFNFDFEPPARINGRMDDHAMRHARYLEIYKADPAPL